jgi:Zn-dependent protease
VKWTFRLGTVFGIELRMHATFPLLLLFVAVSQYRAVGTLAGAASGVAFMLAIFGIVVLHELGHALTALRFGVRTRDIILLPIGGIARLERMPERPLHQLLVAIAGPAANVVLALLLTLLAVTLAHPIAADWTQPLSGQTVLGRLIGVNISLALFNLIPAFPLDGGRVLRALLAMRTDYVRATQSAARIGQRLAFVLGAVGLFINPTLTLIAVFIWMTAAAEAGSVEAAALLKGETVRRRPDPHCRHRCEHRRTPPNTAEHPHGAATGIVNPLSRHLSSPGAACVGSSAATVVTVIFPTNATACPPAPTPISIRFAASTHPVHRLTNARSRVITTAVMATASISSSAATAQNNTDEPIRSSQASIDASMSPPSPGSSPRPGRLDTLRYCVAWSA